MIYLTKNEKFTLKMLLDNPRVSDRTIAEKLKISSQAVGKIRRRLEKEVIKSYSTNLDCNSLGLTTFALAFGRINLGDNERSVDEVEKSIVNDPNVIQVYKLSGKNVQYAILYGFGDLTQMEKHFDHIKKKKDMHNFIDLVDLHVFSKENMLKNSMRDCFLKMFEETQQKVETKNISLDYF